MKLLEFVLYAIVAVWFGWALYVLVMGIYRAYLDKRLGTYTKVLSAPFILIGIVADVLANALLASVVFLELPKEWLLTQRFERYIAEYGTGGGLSGWRYRVAKFVCDKLLDVFDPSGEHC